MKAAEYVRASTDHQQYSIINQQAAIAEYAAARSIEIVRTYADPAKSGLDIKRRPGLQKLLDDVLSGDADFEAVLVFDVSRWGRFQDSDEAACYEFLCKRAKIRVHYCAEPFANDGSVLSNFVKMVKRTMAAEYLRELSSRVRAGQCRIAAKGFKLGGSPGLGLRRVLLDEHGNQKMILADGERKSLALDRVSLIPGPKDEVRLVRKVFSMYLDKGMGIRTITRVLNESHVPCGKLSKWEKSFVRRLLTNPRYMGSMVFNRTSQTLGTKLVRNPPEKWIVVPNAFPAIVSQDVFDRTQIKIQRQVIHRTDNQLLAELRVYVESNKRGLPERKVGDLANAATYRYRFGSILKAYKAIGYKPNRQSLESLALRRRIAAFRAELGQQLRDELTSVGISSAFDQYACLVIGSHYVEKGSPRWRVNSDRLLTTQSVIVARLEASNNAVQDFVYFATHPTSSRRFTFGAKRVTKKAAIYSTLHEVVLGIFTGIES
jgi:DNA invertase Pin-like site-specific DNA recombinase